MTEKADEPESMNVKPSELPFASNALDVPNIFADDIRGAFVANGIARLNLIEHRIDTITNQPVSVCLAKLLIPASNLEAWGHFFLRMAATPEQSEANEGSPENIVNGE